jgi:hypothetical protein
LLAAAVLAIGMIAGPGIAWYSDTDTDTADTMTTDSGGESTELDTTDDDVTEPDTVESHNDKANANSQSVITLSGCTVNSSKDISSVTLLDDGSQLDKDDSVDSRTYDLNSFGDIDEVDAIRVKAGTTIATFSVNCGTDDDTTTDGDDADHHGDDDDADHDDDGDADHHGDDTETDAEWDARHEHKDHEEIH